MPVDPTAADRAAATRIIEIRRNACGYLPGMTDSNWQELTDAWAEIIAEYMEPERNDAKHCRALIDQIRRDCTPSDELTPAPVCESNRVREA